MVLHVVVWVCEFVVVSYVVVCWLCCLLALMLWCVVVGLDIVDILVGVGVVL